MVQGSVHTDLLAIPVIAKNGYSTLLVEVSVNGS